MKLEKETSLFNPEEGKSIAAVNEKAANAAGTATKFVSETVNGIFVHPENDTSNGVRIQNGIQLLRNGKVVSDFAANGNTIGEDGLMQMIQGSDELYFRVKIGTDTYYVPVKLVGRDYVGYIELDNENIQINGSHGSEVDGVAIDSLGIFVYGNNNNRHAEIHLEAYGVDSGDFPRSFVIDDESFHFYNGDVYLEDGHLFVGAEKAYPEIESGWQTYSGAGRPVVFRQGSVVHFNWQCAPTRTVTLDTNRVTVCQLPNGYIPSRSIFQLCQGSGMRMFEMTITSSGEVQVARLRNQNSSDYLDADSSMWFPLSATFIIDPDYYY